MSVTAGETRVQTAASRWSLAYVWIAGLALYCLAILVTDHPRALAWVNNAAWTLASAAAAGICFYAARGVEHARRKAWRLFGVACVSWLIGQLHWDYNELVLGESLPFPSIGTLFFAGFAMLTVAALLKLPESREATPFTLRHLGNIGLVGCCLVATIVLGILEPAIEARVPIVTVWVLGLHTSAVASTFLVALYALWTHRWGASWTPMLLIVIGTGLYSVSTLVYAHAQITGSYLPSDIINANWLLMFGLLAAAGWEQMWLSAHGRTAGPRRMQARERWLEAVVPALMIVIMALVALSNVPSLTPRVIAVASGLFLLFAIILGAREAWIQNESQHLTNRLVDANQQSQATNAELRRSETRYRELNAALEQRVAERTEELKRAYDELEGFSYAVAHDLKAPLRAINSFTHLLEAEVREQASPKGREHMERIRVGALKMAALIDDLLSYSHADRRGMRASMVSMPALLDTVVAPFMEEAQRRRVALTTQIESISMQVDSEGLALALRNLLENAFKYTRDTAQPRIEVTCRRTESGVLLSVTDNGIGFDMQYHEHIFKVFQRLHRDDEYPGTGIGLALVRKAIERIGGRVWAQSKVGEGAAFFVELPTRSD